MLTGLSDIHPAAFSGQDKILVEYSTIYSEPVTPDVRFQGVL